MSIPSLPIHPIRLSSLDPFAVSLDYNPQLNSFEDLPHSNVRHASKASAIILECVSFARVGVCSRFTAALRLLRRS